jgi:hypothetical protein
MQTNRSQADDSFLRERERLPNDYKKIIIKLQLKNGFLILTGTLVSISKLNRLI